MEILLLVIATIFIAILLNAVLTFFPSKSHSKLPPGPRPLPIIGPILWLLKPSTEKEHLLRHLGSIFGPITTLYSGSTPQIFISDHSLAYQALVQNGAVFADRPKAPPIGAVLRSKEFEINSAGYGPVWRLLRRNLTSNILHPVKSKDFSRDRKRVLEMLFARLGKRDGNVKVIDHFRFATFSLLAFMCFGDELDESDIKEIQEVVHEPLTSFNRFQVLNSRPWLTRFFLRSRWNELLYWRKKQDTVMIPHIRAHKQLKQQKSKTTTCYVNTLLELEISEDGNVTRKLTEEEMVTACCEFLAAGYDTTSTALQWIMANLVKYPAIQSNIVEEIKQIMGEETREVEEDELSKLSYLKCVILEGLRRHPPFHSVIPHSVTQQVKLSGYTIPKNATINFTIAEMGWDANVWDDPMEFRPERFMSEDGFDITGSRKIMMMPFGAGRRICPGIGFALHHLAFFVANLVWKFEWRSVEGEEVDLSEMQEFTIVMKNPLHCNIFHRKFE
ncbi:hypothetical protein RND81_13G171200 [Saponaria officinalis]|uniref:Cytochrome P450 n=1 Tax=Saponaria officinalis TaxID=3572 RepID=A0AAW1H632_SAPOF